MGLQQLSGIDGVLFYAPVLIAQAGTCPCLSFIPITYKAQGLTTKGVPLGFRRIGGHQLRQRRSCVVLPNGSVGTPAVLHF